jgi:hypothetical protein
MKSNQREVESQLFAIKDYLTLTSYVPKKKKAVILFSTNQHDSKFDLDSKKPEIIIDYNQYKGLLWI